MRKTRLLRNTALAALPLLLAFLACAVSDPQSSSSQAAKLATPITVTPSVHEVANTIHYYAGGPDYVSATCPSGEYALGGGWSVDPNSRVVAALVFNNIWYVFVDYPQTTPEPAYASVAYVECLRGVAGATVVQRKTVSNIPAADFQAFDPTIGTITVSDACNPGEVRVGSGFDLRAQNRIVELKQSATTDGQHDAWVFGANNYLAEPTILYTYIECLSNVMALTLRNAVADKMSVSSSYPVSTTSYDTNDGAGSTMACPPTAILAGGGFSYKNYYISESYPAQRIVSNAVSLHSTSSGWEGRISPSRFTVQIPSTNQSLPSHTEQISLQVYASAVCLSFSLSRPSGR
jgi:hypothetical protein